MRFFLIVLTSCALLASCTARNEGILTTDDPSLELIRPFLVALPLPSGWTLNDGTPKGTDAHSATLVLELTRGAIPADIPAHGPGNSIRVRAGRRYLAPAVHLWDALEGTSDETLSSVRILPLDDISPPLRALPVNGKYPGDDGYSLVEERRLLLTGADAPLVSWLVRIGEAIDGRDGLSGAGAIAWLSFAGDVMPGRGVESLLAGRTGPERVFGDVLPLMTAADLLLANLEGAVTLRGTPALKGYTFRYGPDVLGPLSDSGFDYLSVTNNHVFDYGAAGFQDTLVNLERAGIGTSGAGKTLGEASRSWTRSVKGLDVSVLSLGAYPVEKSGWDGKREARAGENRPGILWEGTEAIQAINAASENDAFVIVMVHGGEEWQDRPGAFQKSLYRSLIDAGADLVVGAHPHVLQGIEAYGGRAVAYSLGNFLFPGMGQTVHGEESLLLTVGVVNGAAKYFQYTPVRLDGTHIARDARGTILPRFLSLTREVNAASGVKPSP